MNTVTIFPPSPAKRLFMVVGLSCFLLSTTAWAEGRRLAVKTVPLVSAQKASAQPDIVNGYSLKAPKMTQSMARVMADGKVSRVCRDVGVATKSLLVDDERKGKELLK